MNSIGLALLSIVLSGVAIARYGGVREQRAAPAEFAQEYAIDIRRPDVAMSLPLAPSGDVAADLLADATLRDVLLPTNLTDVSPEVRAAWLRAVPRYDEQMAAATQLMLGAIAINPGWPYHQSLLGQLVFARRSQVLSSSLVTDYVRWSVPMRTAAAAAANDDAPWQSLAIAYLQTWPMLSAVHRPTAPAVFHRAFADADFVRNAFAPATEIVGTPTAISFLPDAPGPLWSAFEHLAKSGQMDSAWSVFRRWDAAEWRQRNADLMAIEHYSRRGDVEQVRQRCSTWAAVHSVWDYDSDPARAQAARLLSLWPEGAGRWLGDPRAEIVRYFLAGRTTSINGASLAAAVELLEGVPAAVQAQVRVLASDIAGAERIAQSSETFGTLAWKNYVLELSRYWMRRGDRTRARDALALLPAAAREECEPAVLRAAIGGGARLPFPIAVTREAPRGVDLPVCVDRASMITFEINLTAGEHAVLHYGWDGARTGSVLGRREKPMIVRTGVGEGAHVFHARAVPPATNVDIRVTGPR